MKTILIAEDEKFIRKGLVTMVRRSGVPVETILEARDGEEALELLRQNQVDLLITDIRMPKMDGIKLVSQLGELDHCSSRWSGSGCSRPWKSWRTSTAKSRISRRNRDSGSCAPCAS